VTTDRVDATHATAGAEADEASARRLDGLVAVVTGGAGVIGTGIARRFLESGARVALGDIDADRVGAAAADLGTAGDVVGMSVDVSSQADAGRFIEEAARTFGRLDVLVNGAGITHVDPLLDVDASTWRRVFAVNLEGALFCLQAAARIMREQVPDPVRMRRGAIVNIGSQGSEWPIPTSTAYGASKKALIYLTQTAAVDLEPAAVAVSVVLPGMVYEGMWKAVNAKRSAMRGEDLGERVRRDLADTPSGRFQTPRELADIVLYAVTTPGLGVNGKVIWSEPHVT
jgi:NAD(P)-dependent dehydrogenase (short-subunit alcohol dehydrogenase family)